jgi:aminoglycoside phosphotransferase (APT) family kinase protein
VLYYLKILLFIVLFCATLEGQNYSYSELLGICELEQVEALQEAKMAFGWQEDTQFQSLDGGFTRAKVYSFEHQGKKYVLRFLVLQPSHPKEMRQSEIEALKIGNKLGIAPYCVFSDREALLTVMPYISGHALHHPDDQQLSQLGKMVRTLHDYSGVYPTRYSLKDRIELQYRKAIKSGVAYPTGFDEEVQKILSNSCERALVPSHGDLNLSNILIDGFGGINIIDWTTATWEDPFADLSYFCLLSGLSPAQEEVFLKAYFGREPSAKEYQILKEEKATVCLLTATLWLRYSETLEESAMPLAVRMAALDKELNSPTLKPMQDYLRERMVVDLKTAPKAAIKSYALSFYKAYLAAQD